MILKKYFPPALVLLMFLFASCEYLSTDIHYVEPVAGPEPVITPLVNLEEDSVYAISDSMLVRYETYLSNSRLYFVEASIEDQVYYDLQPSYDPDTIFDTPVAVDSFYLKNAFSLDSGQYTLYLDFYYSPNTGSLADWFWLEYSLTTLEYEVILEASHP